MNIPQLSPIYVCTNTERHEPSAFLLLGMSKKGKVYVLDEWYREGEESFTSIEAVGYLVDWLKDAKEEYFDVLAPANKGHKAYLQPDWVFTQTKKFAEHFYYNHRGNIALRFRVGNTDEDQGIDRIGMLIKTDRLIGIKENCPNLRREMETTTLDEMKPTLACLVDGVNMLFSSHARRRIQGDVAIDEERLSNKELIQRFFN